jgi:VIT1/CCC1 family predicted Fe2+/Mn2+ transporter
MRAPHIEKHFTAGLFVRDVVIGMSDGLTVPFALAAGLTGAVDSVGIIVTAGFAEIAAGAIAMGLGGYLAGRLRTKWASLHGDEVYFRDTALAYKPDVVIIAAANSGPSVVLN